MAKAAMDKPGVLCVVSIMFFLVTLFHVALTLDVTNDFAFDDRHPNLLLSMAIVNWCMAIALFLCLIPQLLPNPDRDLTAMSVTLLQSLMDTIQSVDRMATNPSIGKEDCLLKVRQDLCGLMQILISEPHRTSFAIPAPVDFFMDSFVVEKTAEQISESMQKNLTSIPVELQDS